VISLLSELVPLLIFAAFALRRLLTYLHIFQQEEYDGPRFLRWLIATGSVDRKLSLALLALGIAAFFVGAQHDWILAGAGALLAVFAVLETDPRKRAKKKLVLTARASRIFAVAFAMTLVSALLVLWLAPWGTIWIVPVQLIPFELVAANVLLSPLEARIQQKFWDEAHDKLRRLAPVVIGITGSYGKTSVKHILGHVLEATSSALITPGSVNTPMGIARIVRERLQPWHRHFVVEMGAYGPGSIARLCRLAPPSLALITAIGKAHFERFKSLDTVARTKLELAEAAAQNGGKLITHEDVLSFADAKAFADTHPDLVVVCGTDADAALKLASIRHEPTGLVVDVAWRAMPYRLSVPLFGIHQAQNVALAFAAACTLGVDPDAAIVALRSTPQIAHRLEVKNDGNSIVIDDGYNSNPVGFAAALDLVALLKGPSGRGLLITPGMVELGTAHDEEHARLGRKAAGIVDVLLPVVPDRIAAFVAAFRAASPAATVVPCASFAAAREWLSGKLLSGDVLLIENDLPDLYERRLRL
jgi:UDP-N-acetylmuramoyl-tripeptide--D-alanyl-D-alanine ligase